jgi:ABC-type sugar transport system ATPase subunit
VLNGGLVEQKGPPLEVYERPRTKFVATFLGSPQMNMIDGKLVRDGNGLYAEGGAVRALVDQDRFGKLDEGRDVTIGIRPHDLVLAKDGAPKIADVEVDLVEMLGSEAFLHGQGLILRIEPDEAKSVKPGARVPLAAAPARVHLFDAKTGIACDAS